ncbi:MAG TPA: MFS transporter, partial [Acidimicrobiales bacterium]|nr:MFS transporter [Acidimicrobiales bacterium]
FRPALAAVPPVIGSIRAADHLSAAAAGLLTTIPLVCFGLVAPVAGRIASVVPVGGLVPLCLLGLTAGIVVRSLPATAALYLGTVVIGVAIAVQNVLMPALVKQHFPGHVGLMTGLNLVMLNGGAAVAAGSTVPLARAAHVDWRVAISWWAVTATTAALAWLPRRHRVRSSVAAPDATADRSVWRSAVAWQLTLFMGLVSVEFYSVLTWLPTILHTAGASLTRAGWMLSAVALTSIASALGASLLANRSRDQRLVVTVATVVTMGGLAGVLASPLHPVVLWAILLGIGQGAAFAVFLVMVVLRSGSPLQAVALSGMSQGVGYLIAAAGPTTLGAVSDLAGGWTLPLALLIALGGPQLAFGWAAARDRPVLWPAT